MRKKSKAARLWGKAVRTVSKLFPENHFLQGTEYRIASPKIPLAFDGYRIIQLSDLHGCSFGRDNRRLMKKIDSARPDLVVMTGDMADRLDKDFRMLFRFSSALCKKYPVYFVVGNHEQERTGSRRREYLAGLCRQGIRVLDNERTDIQKNGERIYLYGLRIPMKYYRHSHSGTCRPGLAAEAVEGILGRCDRNVFSILLTHNPLFFDAYAEWGADLTLCGHMHGGMIRLPVLGGLLSPERRFFPPYSGGVYQSKFRECKKMIVSRGLGSGARIRNRPEVVATTLVRKGSEEC